MEVERQPTGDGAGQVVRHLACTEVWGGNRTIDTDVELPGLRGHIFSRPCAGGRGGDIHYLSVCGAGRIARMCLADVAGHGEKVAAVSTEIHLLLRRCMNWSDQRAVLARLNRRLLELGLETLTTAALASHDVPGGKLAVSYAGHPPAWYARVDSDTWERLRPERGGEGAEMANLPLGVDPRVEYTGCTVSVSPGDRLLLVTDGVLEAPDPQGRPFGEQRVAELLSAHKHAGPSTLCRVLVEALTAFCAGNLEHDDVTILLVEFAPPQN